MQPPLVSYLQPNAQEDLLMTWLGDVGSIGHPSPLGNSGSDRQVNL